MSVFATSGEFVAQVGKGYLQKPEGIAIDEDGYVYMSLMINKKILFFNLDILFPPDIII